MPGGIPIPLVRIGFMGRDDKAPKGLGAAMVQDAARRVWLNEDIAAWGLTLEAEEASPTLMKWYENVGFFTARVGKDSRLKAGTMYGGFHHLLPAEVSKPPKWKPPPKPS